MAPRSPASMLTVRCKVVFLSWPHVLKCVVKCFLSQDPSRITAAACSRAAPPRTPTTPSRWLATAPRAARTIGWSRTPGAQVTASRGQGVGQLRSPVPRLGRERLHPRQERRGHVRHWQDDGHPGVWRRGRKSCQQNIRKRHLLRTFSLLKVPASQHFPFPLKNLV